MGDKKKLKILISITVAVAVLSYVAVMFFAPSEGFNGLLFNTLKSAIIIVVAAIIITAEIKHKSITKTNNISKYIAIGVILYAAIAISSIYIGHKTVNDFRNERKKVVLDISDYDIYRTNYSKLGTLYHLNITLDDKQTSFYIQEDTYNAIKEVRQIEVEYYPKNNVVYSVDCDNIVTTDNNSNNTTNISDDSVPASSEVTGEDNVAEDIF